MIKKIKKNISREGIDKKRIISDPFLGKSKGKMPIVRLAFFYLAKAEAFGMKRKLWYNCCETVEWFAVVVHWEKQYMKYKRKQWHKENEVTNY